MSVNQHHKTADDEEAFADFGEQLHSIFRERDSSLWCNEARDATETEDPEDQWSLKRASPITEEDDEELMSFESPTKKSKVENICWENRLPDDKPFDLSCVMMDEGRDPSC